MEALAGLGDAAAGAGSSVAGAAADAGMGDTMSTLLGDSVQSGVNKALTPHGPNLQPMTAPSTMPGSSTQQSQALQQIIKRLQSGNP
jgi:hypothetical protein